MSTEKNSNNTKPNIDYQIEITTQTLERNLGFISNCDNKASIILTAVGVLLTIILTSEGLASIKDILKKSLSQITFLNFLYMFMFFSSVIILLSGILFLISVLIARSGISETKGSKNSLIFFGGINSFNRIANYEKAIKKMDKKDLLDDLISQIYINSKIATKKYRRYNLGLKFTVIGFFLFIGVILFGHYIYL